MEKAHSFQLIIDEALDAFPAQAPPITAPVHILPVSELRYQAGILENLQKRQTAPTGRCHMGVAGLFNLQIAAQTRPEYLLLLDCNTEQKKFWDAAVSLFSVCPTADDFIKTLIADIKKEGEGMQGHYLFDPAHGSESTEKPLKLRISDVSELQAYLDAPWFHEAYDYFHSMAQGEKIATGTLDIIHDRDRCKSLSEALQTNGIAADTCYWSNVVSFFMPHVISPGFGGGKVKRFTDHVDGNAHRPDVKFDGYTYYCESLGKSGRQMFDDLMGNISVLGADATSTHVLVNTQKWDPAIVTQGPPVSLARAAMREKNIALQ